MNFLRSTRWYTLFAVLILRQAGGIAHAQRIDGPQESHSKAWALLIGIERYEKASALRYTVNDVAQIAETLSNRGAFRTDRILQIVDTAQDSKQLPTRNNLLQQIPSFMQQPAEQDQVIVYFSGHGFRDDDGKLYLAPIVCDPRNPAATGIPVQWFREQLASCKAKFKLLILDACHAGSEKEATVPPHDLGEAFRDVLGVVTIAISKTDEKSLIWERQEQSLFSYWLNRGLQGNADSDGQVKIDELYDYVHRKVTFSAQQHFSRPQTPVRIVRSGTVGVPVVNR